VWTIRLHTHYLQFQVVQHAHSTYNTGFKLYIGPSRCCCSINQDITAAVRNGIRSHGWSCATMKKSIRYLNFQKRFKKAVSVVFKNTIMIHVVVVESHHHVLEHIHTVLRQRRLLNQDWSMLHFDSHADLACPGDHIPAIACYRPQQQNILMTSDSVNADHDDDDDDDDNDDDGQPTDGKNLYELLDSTASGIAEWILPLVVAANLCSICWIRPPNTVPLIPSGSHTFNVGVYMNPVATSGPPKPDAVTSFLDLPLNATVKVDWDCLYYMEDSSFIPTTELVLAQPLHLTVIEGPIDANTDTGETSESNNKNNNNNHSDLYALDICLDYFSCYNPFLKDIEQRNPALAKALSDAVIHCTIYKSSSRNLNQDFSTFRYHLVNILESLRDIESQEDLTTVVTPLVPLYDDPQFALKCFYRIQTSLQDYIGTAEEYKELIEMAVEAIPYLTMPHTTLGVDAIDESSVQQRLEYMRHKILQYNKSTTLDAPFIITIARSANDGFTPSHIVEYLQDTVLTEIHSTYCGCNNPIKTHPLSLPNITGVDPSSNVALSCRLNISFDY
jgi:UPF0489 domain